MIQRHGRVEIVLESGALSGGGINFIVPPSVKKNGIRIGRNRGVGNVHLETWKAMPMKSFRQATIGGWFLLAFVLQGCGHELPRTTPDKEGFSASKLARVKTVVQAVIDKRETPGVVVLIARHGKIVELEGFGKMSIEDNKPMAQDTIFRFYSMSKPITTVAAMMLSEEGRFQLDDPVAKYLPELKGVRVSTGKEGETVAAKREMTIRDLMRHTSGFTYGFFGNSLVDRLYLQNELFSGDLADMVRKLGKLPLEYQPGTHFNYSVSTDVLGRLIEVVSGKPLDQFFSERIFQPLDMHDTGFWVPKEKLARLATMYRAGARGSLQAGDSPATSPLQRRPRLLSGGGGLLSTARDYARFCQMLLQDGEFQGKRLLRAETVKEMTHNQLPAEALPMSLDGAPIPGLDFGLGFAIRPDQGKSAGEYSWSGAASTFFWIAPKEDLFVIVLQQVMPLTIKLQQTLKPLIYSAIDD